MWSLTAIVAVGAVAVAVAAVASQSHYSADNKQRDFSYLLFFLSKTNRY